ncbi:GNAT family N-acetyltransferase [Methanobrevibacter sp. DSM 116169]|uniref:GNAT family N-acetyltransferase n=1 Tax=Methanobrevibacter sp. DSM 116169 TaxID=3242727 RepID=UPI0038FCC602
MNSIKIKLTKENDFTNIMDVEKQAFGYDKEAKLVADLLKDKTAEPMVSLLAFHDKEAIGHILFTRAYFYGQKEQPMMHILAPLAIKPKYQNQGIGGLLIQTGLKLLQKKGSKLVFVLGHKEYYPKFGFIPGAESKGYLPPYPILEEYKDSWMVQSLNEKGFDIGKGKIMCCIELNKPEHWRDDESDR